MLKFAIEYREQLNSLFISTIHVEKYKYYNCRSWYNFELRLDNDTWNSLQMVSIDKDGNILGYLGADFDKDSRIVNNIYAINFYDVNYTFSKDLHDFVSQLFTKFDFNKICISAVLNNPATKMYEKYINRYGGREVGIQKQHIRLYDGQLYDYKLFELMKEDYLKNK